MAQVSASPDNIDALLAKIQNQIGLIPCVPGSGEDVKNLAEAYALLAAVYK